MTKWRDADSIFNTKVLDFSLNFRELTMLTIIKRLDENETEIPGI